MTGGGLRVGEGHRGQIYAICRPIIPKWISDRKLEENHSLFYRVFLLISESIDAMM